MKTLKLKSTLFSLIAIAMVTVFLSSCEKESTKETSEITEKLEDNQLIELPDEFDNLNKEELEIYLDSLSDQELQSLLSDSSSEKIEDRCASVWKDIPYFITCKYYFWHYCHKNYGRPVKLQRQKRWCGPPTNGGYHYRWVILSSCC